MTAFRSKLASIALGLMVTAGGVTGPAGVAEGPAKPVPSLEKLPAAVRQAAQAETQGATIRGVSKERGEDGVMVYEVETIANGLTHDLIIGMDGTVLVSEQQVRLASLTSAVRGAILKGAAGKKVILVESVSKAGKLVYYEAQLRSGKAGSEIKVDPDGKRVP